MKLITAAAPDLARPKVHMGWPDNPRGVCPCHDSPSDHERSEAAAARIRESEAALYQPDGNLLS